MTEPKHKTIKVWMDTYRELKRLAAERPESMAALINRLVWQEREHRVGLLPGLQQAAQDDPKLPDDA